MEVSSEKIKSWLFLDCLEKWWDNWSSNSLYHQERSVDDQEVISYSNYLDSCAIGKHCLHPRCQKHWQNHWKQKVQDKFPDYQKEVELLKSFKTTSLNLEDYSKLKKIKQETKKWEKELENGLVKSEVEQLLKGTEELESKFPERIRLKSKSKSKDCFHKIFLAALISLSKTLS